LILLRDTKNIYEIRTQRNSMVKGAMISTTHYQIPRGVLLHLVALVIKTKRTGTGVDEAVVLVAFAHVLVEADADVVLGWLTVEVRDLEC
jgi:hypothetical protein